ncbi:Uncharacterised protein [Mycobacteroides abscessus subsp. massiliense]|nr:Uncharacterised protein [Mycobacteroides abscessus subsp. massiliense]
MQHVVIETQSSVWTWLGPVLLFIGAMITLWVTTQSANKREWNKWRRETLIKLCSEAVDAALEAAAKCESALVIHKLDMVANSEMAATSKCAGRIGTIAEQLYLVGAIHIADTGAHMKAAVEALRVPTSQLRSARKLLKDREGQVYKQINEQYPGWKVEGSPADIEYTAKLNEAIGSIRKEEWLVTSEANYAAAQKELEDIRLTFIKRGKLELKSTN